LNSADSADTVLEQFNPGSIAIHGLMLCEDGSVLYGPGFWTALFVERANCPISSNKVYAQ
jgi:hypothetical protein